MLVKLLTWMCIITITLLTFIVLLQVVTRFFDYSLPGTEELSRLFIVWLTFLGSSLAIYEKMHLAVNYFVNKFKTKYRKIFYILVNALIIVFYAVLTFYGFKLSMSAMSQTSSTLQLPVGISYLAIPVSGLFSLYFIVINLTSSPTEEEEGMTS
ncbi:TRAP transporter small permease [Salinicoccus siamensis]|uniref:TRAP transporter small permease n=1 Tax=Salinicoccus siamensis TaxID=381830 RepID=A0ABV5Z3S4_9STAP